MVSNVEFVVAVDIEAVVIVEVVVAVSTGETELLLLLLLTKMFSLRPRRTCNKFFHCHLGYYNPKFTFSATW